MKKYLQFLIVLLIISSGGHTQTTQPFSQLKSFQQNLTAANVQFFFPKDFKEIKALHTAHVDIDYAIALPNKDFQVWYLVKNVQQEWPKLKITEDNSKRAAINPDSVYSTTSLYAAMQLAGKDNFTTKNLPPDVLSIFHADRGKSYELNLYDRADTKHYQYGLLISLQKDGVGYVSMLFLGNDNGPDFYKNVNRAYYSIKFN